MSRLAEDGGNYRAPAPKKAAVKKPVAPKHRGQISGVETGGYTPRPKAYKAPAPRKIVDYYAPKKSSGYSGRSNSSSSSRSSGSSSRSRSNYSSNSYSKRPVVSRPSSGASSRGTIAPTVAKPVVKPVIPKFDEYKDDIYKQQDSDLLAAFKAFTERQGADLASYGTNYKTTLGRLQEDQTQGAGDLAEDYSGRGLLESGVYTNALNDYNADFDKQRADLSTAKQLYETDRNNEKAEYTTQQDLTRKQAYQDALNRYNLKYK